MGISKLKLVFVLTVAYAVFAFAYSFVGFASPLGKVVEPPVSESLSGPVVELGGHFIFGAIAALAFWDPTLIAFTGGLAVIIDVDHFLSMWFQSPMDRPAHSILFICLSAVALAYVAKRLGARNGILVKIAFAAPISVLAHIAYDVFAANMLSWDGSNVPLFIPVSYRVIDLPNYAWIVLEAAAFVGALLVQLCSDVLLQPSPHPPNVTLARDESLASETTYPHATEVKST